MKPPAPAFPKLIRVVRHRTDTAYVEIDGERVPWLIAEDGVAIGGLGLRDCPTVALTFLADKVEVVNDLDPPAEDDPAT